MVLMRMDLNPCWRIQALSSSLFFTRKIQSYLWIIANANDTICRKSHLSLCCGLLTRFLHVQVSLTRHNCLAVAYFSQGEPQYNKEHSFQELSYTTHRIPKYTMLDTPKSLIFILRIFHIGRAGYA